jgi:Tfp pilus assembly protein, pilus retraction ATPase PilT
MDPAELLRYAVERRASDVHLKAGNVPFIRVDGELLPAPFPSLTAAETRAAADALMPSHKADEFARTKEADFAYTLEGVGRFRVNVLRESDTVGLAIRWVSPEDLTFEQLHLPETIRSLAETKRGLVLVTGPTGAGKTTTIAALIGPALELKRQHDRSLPFKIWESSRRQIGKVIGAGHVGLKLILLLATAVGALLFTTTGDFRVASKALLEGEVQRVAVAPFQGYVKTAPVRAGDIVKTGQVLATLQDRDLQLERLKRLNEREQLVKEHRQALAERNAPKAEIVTAQLRQVQAQLDLAADKLLRTQVVAPFAGVVVSGDLSQQLDAPVEEGKVLFEIAPLDTYRIVLQVDERDIGHVAVGQSGDLLLSALPHDLLPFKVEKITPVSTAHEGRNFFRVEGRFSTKPSQLRPAMEGVGKISIDRRLLVWIWTHDAVEWLRLKLWAWLP